jgi:hypothetical protein
MRDQNSPTRSTRKEKPMAFRNFLGMPNNYCVIVVDGYDKHNRSVMFKVRVYEDSTKKTVIAELPYDFSVRSSEYLWAIDRLNTPPASPEEGDTYLVGLSPTGAWTDRQNGVATYKNGKWKIVDHAAGNTLYLADTQEVLVRNKDMGWDIYDGGYDPDIWDSFFDVGLFDNVNYNLLKAMYVYVKTLPEFQGVIDI